VFQQGYWGVGGWRRAFVLSTSGEYNGVNSIMLNLVEAIELILEDRWADILRGLPDDAIQEKILVG